MGRIRQTVCERRKEKASTEAPSAFIRTSLGCATLRVVRGLGHASLTRGGPVAVGVGGRRGKLVDAMLLLALGCRPDPLHSLPRESGSCSLLATPCLEPLWPGVAFKDPVWFAGAYGNDGGGTDAGAVYQLPGDATSLSFVKYDAVVKLVGEEAYDYAGVSVSGGDADGDGYGDVLVAASGHGEFDVGAVYLVRGPISANDGYGGGELDLKWADAKLTGEDHVASVRGGDLNADGLTDIVVGAPEHDEPSDANIGAVYAVFSPVSGEMSLEESDYRLLGAAAGDNAGLVDLGDFDGDGRDDIAVGASEAYIVFATSMY